MINSDIIIIGGGAAGCFAAVCAAEQGKRVLLLEPGRLMHKLGITGKGRCNLTNNSDTETILKHIKTNPRFLQGTLTRFGSADVMAFFENLGVRLGTERGNRVFPVSGLASDVVGALNMRMNILGVEIIKDRAVEILQANDVLVGVKCEKNSYYAPKAILASGGLSYPKTGSTGDGYKLAAAAGHTVTPLKPALVPIITREDCSELAGLSLKNVKLSLFSADMNDEGCSRNSHSLLYAGQGELLFTHFGISGPLALSASCYAEQSTSGNQQIIKIDLKPALDEKKLDARLLRDFSENKNKQIQNALGALLPKIIIPCVISRANIQPDKQVNEITVAERGRLLAALKGFTLTFAGVRPIDEAVITDGGIDVREINPKTMESKLIKGLHFAGEVIDVAAFTGGFNLQIAFSTAYAAAIEGINKNLY
ncbi:MAG: NAD(P)/FAD-dependent oxidoreductase [Oscillospiraceae bacterium]|jgi:predicted Rossmann fold flavoprotein|nr:NAD(P)/FAD-dependent oxidoreductase [Oscillospiraceae bacterium]